MPDEPKVPPEPAAPSETPKPATPEGATASPPVKPAAAPPRPPAAAKVPVKPDPWSSPLLDQLQNRFPGAITEAVVFRNMPSIIVAKESLLALCAFLKGREGGDYVFLTDETAVDYPKREKRFEIVLHLYSFARNDRLRVKFSVGEGEKAPSLTSAWPAANWLEREIYDMFGVQFEGHPNLKRILLPDDWVGYPLRKDYDILRQDDAWVKANLNIPSGQ